MERQWWQDKVCYQIWPKSFKDSNGDGVGDIPGIIDRLDYLKELGADILWLSPVYKSPLADEGYDIADYRGIDPRFGTMEDMERLLAETKRRGMYVVMDLVVNHCSDEHPWFQKALADPEGPYGKYFYFRKGKNGAPPTNWRGYFGGSVWSPVPGREDLYYLHLFCKKQPDLDWENPAVRREVVEMVNWWLDKGVAGFRVDAIVNIGKPERFEDFAPDRPDGLADCRKMLADPVSRQRLHAYLGQLRDEAFAPHNAFTVGEVFDTDPAELALFIGQGGFFSSMFDFAAACWGGSPKGWYDAKKPGPDNYRDCCFDSALRAAGVGFLSNIIENHDEPRGARWSRDNARTPVQWSAEHAAGFTAGTPWLPVNPNYARVNAAAQQGVEGSVLEFYKSLIRLRKNDKYKEVLVWGGFEPVHQEQAGLAAFMRAGGGRRLLIASNLSGEAQRVELPGAAEEVLLCSDGAPGLAGDILTLAPWQAAVVELA